MTELTDTLRRTFEAIASRPIPRDWTEIAPLLIVIQLEEFNYDAATAIGIAMLLISFAMLLAINLIQVWSRRRIGHV